MGLSEFRLLIISITKFLFLIGSPIYKNLVIGLSGVQFGL